MEAADVVRGGRVPRARYIYGTVDLFLFSAATWNPHRVHYDQEYTREVEGHERLLVQGPLQAAHLFRVLGDALVDGARLTSVRYRHLAALHAGEPVVVDGRVVDLDDDAHAATCEVWMAREESGERTTTGTAVVSVPVTARTR